MTIPSIAFYQRATVRPRLSDTEYGPQTEVDCLAGWKQSVATGQDGAETPLTRGRAFLPPSVVIPPGSEFGFEGGIYRTVSEKRPKSLFGEPYVEVEFE